jgi:hypothetical protein
LAGLSRSWGLPPCLRERSPDEGAPPSLSHCEMLFLGLPLGRLGRVFVVIGSHPSQGVLFAEPFSSGGGSARLRWRSCDLETLFRESCQNCSCNIHPLLRRYDISRLAGSLSRVLEGELDRVDDDREHHILVLHTNLRGCRKGNTASPALFRKAHIRTRSAEASVKIRERFVIRPAIPRTGAPSPQRMPRSFMEAVPSEPTWTFRHTAPHPERED